MRFWQLGPEDRVPDANMLWVFREALIAAGALEGLFGKLDQAITAASGKPDDQFKATLFTRCLVSKVA